MFGPTQPALTGMNIAGKALTVTVEEKAPVEGTISGATFLQRQVAWSALQAFSDTCFASATHLPIHQQNTVWQGK